MLKSFQNIVAPFNIIDAKSSSRKNTLKISKAQTKNVMEIVQNNMNQFHQILQAQQNFEKFLKLKFFKYISQQKNLEDQIKKFCTLSKKKLSQSQKKILQEFLQRSFNPIDSLQSFIKFINEIIEQLDEQIELDSNSSLQTDKSSSIIVQSNNEESRIDLIDLTGDLEQDLNKMKIKSNQYSKDELQIQRGSQDIQQDEIEDQKQFFQQLKIKENEYLKFQERQYQKRMTLPSNLNRINLGLKLDPIIELPIQENSKNFLMSKGNLSKYSLDTYVNRSDRSRKSINLFAHGNKNSSTLLNSKILQKDPSEQNTEKKIGKNKAKKFLSERGKSANVKKKDKQVKLTRKKSLKKKTSKKKNLKPKNKTKNEQRRNSIKQENKNQSPLKEKSQLNKKTKMDNSGINKKVFKKLKKKQYKKSLSKSLNIQKEKYQLKTQSVKKLTLVVSKQTLIQFHQDIQKTFALNDLMKSTALPKKKNNKQLDELKTVQASFQMNELKCDNSLKSIEISKIEKLNLLRPLNSQILEHSDLNLNLMNLIQGGEQSSPSNKNQLKQHVVKLSQFTPNKIQKKDQIEQKKPQEKQSMEQKFRSLLQKAKFRKNKRFQNNDQSNRKSKLQLFLNKSFNISEKDPSIQMNQNDLNQNKFFSTHKNDQRFHNQNFQLTQNTSQAQNEQNFNQAFDIKNYYQNRRNSNARNANRRVSRLSKSFVGSNLDTSQYTILLKDAEDLTKNFQQKPQFENSQFQSLANFKKKDLKSSNQINIKRTDQINTNKFFKSAKKNLIVPLQRSRINSLSQRQVQKGPNKCKSIFVKLIKYSLEMDNTKKQLQNQTNFDTQSLFNYYKTSQNFWNSKSFSQFVQDLGINIQEFYLKNLCYYLNINNDSKKETVDLDQFINFFENIQDNKISLIRTFYQQSNSTNWNIKLLNKDTHILLTNLIKLAIKKIYDLNKKAQNLSSNEIVYSFLKISNKQEFIQWDSFLKFMDIQNQELHPGDNFYVFYEINGNLQKRVAKENFINFFKNIKNFQF